MNNEEKEFLEMEEDRPSFLNEQENIAEKDIPDKEFVIEEKSMENSSMIDENLEKDEIKPDIPTEKLEPSFSDDIEEKNETDMNAQNPFSFDQEDKNMPVEQPDIDPYHANINQYNNIDTEEVPKIEENIDTSSKKQTYSVPNKKHVGMGPRVVSYILIILVFSVIAGIFLSKIINYKRDRTITYQDTGTATYQVCLKENDYYKDACIEENMEYISSLISKIPVQFQYSMEYSDAIPYQYSYYVVGTLSVFDTENPEKILYKNEEVLIDRKNIEGTDKKFDINASVDIDFPKYDQYVNEYKEKYILTSDAVLEVALYLDKEDNPKKVTSIQIPLSKSTFGITKGNTVNKNQQMTIQEDLWNSTNIMYILVSIIALFIVLYFLIRMSRFVSIASGKVSQYRARLQKILREYDRVIVASHGNYEIPSNKRLIKVNNFDELLDARDTLEKPIIYVKVNDVKSEFYVEDEDKIYRYVLKEADFEEK